MFQPPAAPTKRALRQGKSRARAGRTQGRVTLYALPKGIPTRRLHQPRPGAAAEGGRTHVGGRAMGPRTRCRGACGLVGI